jgi:hypothetical protein
LSAASIFYSVEKRLVVALVQDCLQRSSKVFNHESVGQRILFVERLPLPTQRDESELAVVALRDKRERAAIGKTITMQQRAFRCVS